MGFLIKIRFFIITIFLLSSSLFGYSQTSTSTGSWTNGSTWIGGVPPTLSGGGGNLNTDVIISVGNTVTLNGNLTVKSGVTLTVRGTLIITSGGNVDFQNGSTIIVESGGSFVMNGLTNSNNSTNVTINGDLTVNGNYTAGTGASLNGTGGMSVSGTSSGNGTSFGVVLGCDNCSVQTGGVISDVIKDGSQTNQSAPIEPYYKYTYSQQIYYQSEINQIGNITGLSFEYNGNVSTTFDVDVYMGHTTKTSFSSTTNWVPYSDLSLVYSGNYIVNNTAGWYSISLNTPFLYNNVDNLVIAVREKTSAYQSSSTEFYTVDGVVYRVLTSYSDGSVPNPSSPPTANYRSVWVPSLKLVIEPEAQPLPIELLYFKGKNTVDGNLLEWETSSETNNDYFTIYKSSYPIEWSAVSIVEGSGTTSFSKKYKYIDYKFNNEITYYYLRQTDYDGKFKNFTIISIDNRNIGVNYGLIKVVNTLGQEITSETPGLKFFHYSDGTIIKRF